jgi:phosphate transport system protein
LEASLQRDIGLIKSKVGEMARLGERAIRASLQALVERNRQLAYWVILRDQYLDELEVELDRLCLEFIVRQQPVAGHLRFVYTVIKMNKELERIGDYAESVARQAIALSSLEAPPSYEKFVELGHLAAHMVRDAVQAFLSQDAEMAQQTMAIEERANTLRSQINADVLALRQADRLPLAALTPLLTVARRFERVTDQAKNICEEVLYMCTGEFTKHKGTEAFRVVFVDAQNASASQMAEAVGRAMGLARFVFSSAGLTPSEVDQQTLQFLAEKGIDASMQRAKSPDQVPHFDHYHVIVALGQEGASAFPAPPSKTACLVWPMKDPIEASPGAVRQAALEEALQYLKLNIRELAEAILGANEPQEKT